MSSFDQGVFLGGVGPPAVAPNVHLEYHNVVDILFTPLYDTFTKDPAISAAADAGQLSIEGSKFVQIDDWLMEELHSTVAIFDTQIMNLPYSMWHFFSNWTLVPTQYIRQVSVNSALGLRSQVQTQFKKITLEADLTLDDGDVQGMNVSGDAGVVVTGPEASGGPLVKVSLEGLNSVAQAPSLGTVTTGLMVTQLDILVPHVVQTYPPGGCPPVMRNNLGSCQVPGLVNPFSLPKSEGQIVSCAMNMDQGVLTVPCRYLRTMAVYLDYIMAHSNPANTTFTPNGGPVLLGDWSDDRSELSIQVFVLGGICATNSIMRCDPELQATDLYGALSGLESSLKSSGL